LQSAVGKGPHHEPNGHGIGRSRLWVTEEAAVCRHGLQIILT